MAVEYGALKDTVAIAGSLIAAGTAIAVSWTRRANWMPPEETVPTATSRVSGLVCAVVIGALYLLRERIGQVSMIEVAGVLLAAAVMALIVSIWINTAHGFMHEGRRVLGGFRLTDEATAIKVKRRWNEQQLLTNANGLTDLVWTKGSIAAAQIFSTLGFIALIAAGSIALASVALAFGLSTSDKDPSGSATKASPNASVSAPAEQQVVGNSNVQISGPNNFVNPLPSPKAASPAATANASTSMPAQFTTEAPRQPPASQVLPPPTNVPEHVGIHVDHSDNGSKVIGVVEGNYIENAPASASAPTGKK